MLYQYFKNICIFSFLFVSLVLSSLFIRVSPSLGWATGTGCIYYDNRPLNGVEVLDNTTDSRNVSGFSVFGEALYGQGCYYFGKMDCGVLPEKKTITVLGFQNGVPPAGVPAGGSFNPQTIYLGDFSNVENIPVPTVIYTPPGPSATPTPTLAPTATPTPTPTPVACGGPCNTSSECDKSCPICANNTCVAPTPTKVPCGGPCTSNTQCDILCPICANNTCVKPTPTPTPTPSCNCDGVVVQGLFYSGTKVDATGYAKVMNPDTNRAEVLSMVFTLYKDNVKLASSGEIAVGSPERKTDPSGIPIDRYKSNWSFTIPGTGSYKLLEDIYCGWKSSQVLQPQTRVVLGTSTAQKKNIFSFLSDWFSGLFSPKGNLSPNVSLQGLGPTSTPTIPATPTPTPFNPETAKSLKLKTISPNVTTQCKEADFDVPL